MRRSNPKFSNRSTDAENKGSRRENTSSRGRSNSGSDKRESRGKKSFGSKSNSRSRKSQFGSDKNEGRSERKFSSDKKRGSSRRRNDRFDSRRTEEKSERKFSSDKRESRSRNNKFDSKRKEERSERKFSSNKRESRSRDDKFDSKRKVSGRRFSSENRENKGPREFGSKRNDRGGRKNFSGDRRFNNYRKKRKPVVEKEDDGLIRLNKYVANAGICSRREADELIKTGIVEVNGTVITEMGYKVKEGDEVRFDGKRISAEKKSYVLLNKPKGFITTTKDERDRKTVMDLVANATKTRLFPVGRLDRQTTGVLLFTNDGHLAKKLTHPSHNIRKIYHVVLDKDLHGDDMEKIRNGISMAEGIAKVDKISFIEGKSHREIGVEIHIGWNRVVRRLFEKLGYKVEHLDRVQFAGLTKKNVKRGHWRTITQKEVNFLKML